jgi:hypothetical protein
MRNPVSREALPFIVILEKPQRKFIGKPLAGDQAMFDVQNPVAPG